MQIVVEGILTNYEVYGETNKQVIMLLHGWGQDSSHWRLVARELAREYKVVVPDLPGFGASSLPHEPYGVEEYAKFVERLVGKLKLKVNVLVGHSVGGKVAIYLAAHELPITNLVLVAPAGVGKVSWWIKVKIALAKIAKRLLFWVPNAMKTWFTQMWGSEDYRQAGGLLDTFRRVVARNVELEAGIIKVQTLIIWGEKDAELDAGRAKLLRRLISNSTLRVMWGVGHSPNVEAPEKLVDMLREYL